MWQPAGHRVLVKLKSVGNGEKISKGGIILEVPKSLAAEQYATQEAEVVALGLTAYKGYEGDEPWCKEGDTVRIAKYAGENMKDENTGEVYRIINDVDVVAVWSNT